MWSPPPALGQGSSVRVSPNARLGVDANPVRGHDVPALAADPADVNHVVEVDEDFVAKRCTFRVTFDGGRTWAGGDLAAPADFPQPACGRFDGGDYAHVDGSVAFGTGQNVYTTFSWNRPGQTDATLVARSTDGGRSFAPAVVAIDGQATTDTSGNEGFVRPKLAVQARAQGDRVVVASWLITLTGTAEPQARKATTAVSGDSGVTWSAPVNANPPDQKVRELSQPVIAADGAVYVAWRTLDPAPAQNFLIVGKSVDGGVTWSTVQAGPATGTRGSDPKLAVDPRSSTLYLAYWNTPATGDSDVFVCRSADGSATWSAEVRVNDDPMNNGVVQRLPQISVAPTGRVDVVWHDRRNAYKYPSTNTTSPVAELAGARLEDYYYAYSIDGGKTFSANRRLTDRSIDLDTGLDRRVTGGFYWAAMAPLADNRLVVGWGDSRFGNALTDANDIVTATVTVGAADPVPVTPLARLSPPAQSVTLSRLAYPGGGESVSMPTGTGRSTMAVAGTRVVIVNQDDNSGALAASVLARANDGPILLSQKSGLSKDVKDEVKRLQPAGAFIIGTTTQLSAAVAADLKSSGVPDAQIKRLDATGPELARQVADALDFRADADKTSGRAAFDGAVVVNPATKDASTATGLAAELRLPVLFVTADTVPAATTDALQGLGITKTYVVGGTAAISDATMAKMPSPTRLGGTTVQATGDAVAKESLVLGLPTNLFYATDAKVVTTGAALGAVVGRIGGVMVASSGSASDRADISRFGLGSAVDHVVALQAPSTKANTGLIVAEVALGVVGVFLLVGAAFRSRRREKAPPA
jgi:putative cell wall-binding protein